MRTVCPLFLSAVRLRHRALIGTAVLHWILLDHVLFPPYVSVLSFVEVAWHQLFLPAVLSLVSQVIPPPADAQLEAGRGLYSRPLVVSQPAVCIRPGQRVYCMNVFRFLFFSFSGISLARALF